MDFKSSSSISFLSPDQTYKTLFWMHFDLNSSLKTLIWTHFHLMFSYALAFNTFLSQKRSFCCCCVYWGGGGKGGGGGGGDTAFSTVSSQKCSIRTYFDLNRVLLKPCLEHIFTVTRLEHIFIVTESRLEHIFIVTESRLEHIFIVTESLRKGPTVVWGPCPCHLLVQ